jgi:small-conductance mechanosensitive channel
VAGLALAVLLACPGAAVAQPATAGTTEAPPAANTDVEPEQAAPVLLGGEPVVWILAGLAPYTPQVRAERIAERLEAIVHDATIRDPTVTIVDAGGSSELRVQHRLLMVVTARDAQAMGIARQSLAAQAARAFEAAIRAERLRYEPATLIRGAVYGVIATLLLVIGIWIVVRLGRWVQRHVTSWRERWLTSLRVQQAEIISAERLTRVIDRGTTLARVVVVFVLLDVYLTFVLGLFPWTRAASSKLLEYLVTPVRVVVASFVGYLPKLLFVIVIAVIVHVANRLIGAFFSQVQHERIVFPRFPAEWAEPTSKIVRVLLVAFGVVVAFPYLPASGSPAFAGVSVFMGVLISLASSSALSNAIAGLVLMYTGAFRLGDRVKVGDSFGDIVETSMLATRVRTIKNEEITIPNGIVLNSAVTNFSRHARSHGLILHTSVTIGYDAPWRTIHELLIQAALGTPGVLRDPAPFVLQTALNDFYVTYEINAYTDRPQDMIDTYAALHARIQDSFYAAGVEIMSPHYTSLRDGNTVALPPAHRPAAYEPSGFKVDAAVRLPGPDAAPAGERRAGRFAPAGTEQEPAR